MPATNETANLLPADDLLALTFEFVNLHIDVGTDHLPRLVRIQTGQPAFIIVHFQPQVDKVRGRPKYEESSVIGIRKVHTSAIRYMCVGAQTTQGNTFIDRSQNHL